MARRDVDLVIRARDQAAKVVDQISDALREFTDAQKKSDQQAGETKTALGELGAAFGQLSKAIKADQVGQQLSEDMDKAANSVSRLEKKFDELSAKSKETGQALQQATFQTDRLTAKQDGAKKALNRTNAELKEAKADYKGYSSATTQAEREQAKLQARLGRLPEQINRQAESLRKAKVRYAELEQRMVATAEPSATVQRNFVSSTRSVERHRAKLEQLQASYAQTESDLRAASAAVVLFGNEAQKAAADVSRKGRVVEKIEQNYNELTQQAKAAEGQQNRLSKSLNDTTQSLQKTGSQLERAEAGYVELAQAAGQADAALSEMAATGRAQLEGSLKRQRREVDELAAEYLRLGSQVDRMSGTFAENSQEFRRLSSETERAKRQLDEKRGALTQMEAAYREAGSSVESLAQTQRRFNAILSQADNRLDRMEAGLHGVTGAARETARANRQAARETTRLSAAYAQFYGDTRRSLSLLQRIRGEILSMVAAYGGLYAGIEALRGTVRATQQLEAAQSRLLVSTRGDQREAANELDFLRRQADRLGITLDTLATEYSKFRIATQDTNIDAEETRKIFLAVSEAARVNRSSTQEMQGVFTALTQIVSKGAVQMEELRQQLGDRLPGALKLMADGLNVTTAELVSMMENGEITSEALVPFADELTEKFGPQLADALRSTSASLGRLQNAAFEALVAFGRGGFIDAFANFADTLVDVLQSADFRAFIDSASSAMGELVNFVGFAVENFQVLIAAITAFLALRLTPLVIAMAGAMAGFATDVGRSAAQMRVMGAATATTTTRLRAMRTAVSGLRAALVALFSSTGIGLVVAAVAAGLSLWATNADSATEALAAHERVIRRVKNAYDEAGGEVEDWAERLKDVSEIDLRALRPEIVGKLAREIPEVSRALRDLYNDRGLDSAAISSLVELESQFRQGEISARELKDAVNDVLKDQTLKDNSLLRSFVSSTDAVTELQTALAELEAALVVLDEDAPEAAKEAAAEVLGLVQNVDRAANELEEAERKTEQFDSAMEGLSEKIGDANRELEYMAESKAIEKLLQQALIAAQSWGDVAEAIGAAGAAQLALNEDYVSTAVSGSLVDRIIGVESGGDPTARNPNSTATGLGQFIESTWLRMFKQYFPDRAAGMTNAAILALREDADTSRQMVELYLRENAENLQRAGNAVNDANLYLTHFLGPGGANALLDSAPGTPVSEVLSQGQISANSSILEGKTREQVITWAQRKVGISEQELNVVEQMQAAERDRLEQARREAEERQAATATTIEGNQFQIEQQQRINAGREREAAIAEAVREAREANPEISEAELVTIREQAAAMFDLRQQQEGATTAKEQAQKAEERVNQLVQQRQALEAQRDIANQQGDTTRSQELQQQIAGVNEQLVQAIDNAIRMWEAVGGGAADAAIAKLQTARLETENFGQDAQQTYLQWDRVAGLFVNGLANAFDVFARKVSEGEKVGEAARQAFLQFAADFLREIAMMIIKQAIFNALRAAFGGTPVGNLIGVGAAHTGGLIGSSRAGSGNQTRQVNPAVFAGAARYHTGGIVGLKPNEVPAVLEEGEEVLKGDDPRHILNGAGRQQGGGEKSRRPMTIVNAFDAPGFLESALADTAGQEAFVNFVRANKDSVKAAME